MTGTTPPLPCPDCSAPLTGGPTCPACGLRLVGPEALRLWEVDQELASLGSRRTHLLAERTALLSRLRVHAATSSRPPAAPQEWTPQRVQNTLLGLGALLLTVAGIVFAAVTYDRLGAGGRAAVLVGLTAAAGLAVPQLTRRGLQATAETVGLVTLALALLDAYGLRRLGLAGSSSGLAYTAGTCVVVALACGLYAAAVPIRLPRYAGVVLAQLPIPLLLVNGDASPGTAAVALAAQASAGLAAAVAVGRGFAGQLRRDLLRATTACTVGVAVVALLLAAGAAVFDDGRPQGALALLVLAGAAAAAGLVVEGGGRLLLLALPTPLAAGAAVALAADHATGQQLPLVVAAVALAAALGAAQLPFPWRPGPVAGALVTAAAAALTQVDAVAQALTLPFAWLDAPWTLPAGSAARAAVSPDQPWTGTVVTLVVIAAAAVTVAAAGLALHRLQLATPAAAALTAIAAVLLPLGLATSYPLAILVLLALGVALLTAGTVLDRRDLALACLGAGSAVAVLTAAWGLADRNATLLVLPVLAVAFGGVATRWTEATAAAGVTAGAALAAAGAACGLHTDQVGALLLAVPAVLVALTFVLPARLRLPLELAAATLAATSLVLVHGDAGWLSWAFAGVGLVALADALHPDRRAVAAAGGLLLSASSWVRLADAGVTAPEPYVLPIAAVALVLGHLRRRRDPRTRSFPAYGPGLTLLLVPSLVAGLDDATLTRPLLLGGLALGVLLVGAARRLQAPLVIGGGVLAVDALQLLAPYAAAPPRWLTLGAAGLLLVVVGATYEQRRRDLTRLRRRYESLA